MKTVEQVLAIPAHLVAKYTALMQTESVDYQDLQIPKYTTIASWTANFGNGYEIDLKVCSSTDGDPLWSEAVLFLHGNECGCTDVEDSLLGDWDLTDSTPHENHKFILHVVADCEV